MMIIKIIFISSIIIAFAIRQCAAWASTLITHKHSPEEENRGKPKQKGKLCTNSNSLLYLLPA